MGWSEEVHDSRVTTAFLCAKREARLVRTHKIAEPEGNSVAWPLVAVAGVLFSAAALQQDGNWRRVTSKLQHLLGQLPFHDGQQVRKPDFVAQVICISMWCMRNAQQQLGHCSCLLSVDLQIPCMFHVEHSTTTVLPNHASKAMPFQRLMHCDRTGLTNPTEPLSACWSLIAVLIDIICLL